MPGFVIHLATAKEYMRKHSRAIKNENEFFKGVIAPDLTTKENKVVTHYGNNSAEVSLRRYLKDKTIESDFDKGYFLHLVTDYIFYNKILICSSKDIYNDYDILNKYLIEKYSVVIPKEVEEFIFFKSGKAKILDLDMAEKTIDISSNILLENIKNEILSTNYDEKWDKIRPLIRI